MPLPYPHRATFLASTLVVPLKDAAATPYLARLLSLIVFDHFLRHPVVTTIRPPGRRKPRRCRNSCTRSSMGK